MATPQDLDQEYGSQWRQEHVVKVINGGGHAHLRSLRTPGFRRSVWPAQPLLRCNELMGGFFGASIDRKSTDVPWRRFQKTKAGAWWVGEDGSEDDDESSS